MKNLIKNSLVLVVLFTTLLTNANETFVLRNLNNNKTTILTVLDVEQGNQLLIKDVDGIVLYKETIQNSGTFTKGFNLTTLPDGKYYFELKNDLEVKKIAFKVALKQVDLKNVKKSTIEKLLKQPKKISKIISKEDSRELRNSSFKGENFIKYYFSNK